MKMQKYLNKNMAKKKKDIKLGLRYSSINVLKFSQYDVGDFDAKNDDIIEYQTDFAAIVLEKTEEIGIQTTIKLKIIEIDEIFCELKVESRFQVVPFNDIIVKNDKGYDIPDGLLVNFTAIILGTIRGILYEKLKGTILQNEVLPLIDINDLMKNQEV